MPLSNFGARILLTLATWLRLAPALTQLLRKQQWTPLTKARTERSNTLPERQRRAIEAENLLNNPLLIEAVASIEGDLIAQMREVSLSDHDGHLRLITALQTSHAVQRQLWFLIQDGHEATEALNLRGRRID